MTRLFALIAAGVEAFVLTATLASNARAQTEEASSTPAGMADDIQATKSLDSKSRYPVDQPSRSDRVTFVASKSSRGASVSIPESALIKFCSDMDGCTLRLGMHDWDNSGRVASREALFFYNSVNRAWRSSYGDRAGTDYNGVTEHPMYAWACYFTDGKYEGWANKGDGGAGFGLLSWSEYNADCWLSIID